MLKTLVLTYFKGNGGLSIYQSMTATSKKGKTSKIGFSFLFALLMLLYIYMISSSFLSAVLISPRIMYIQAIVVTIMFSVMFSYTSVETILIKAKDLTFLSPLPIDKRTLNLSRLLILYIEVAIESLLVYIPFFIISAIKLKFNAIWYLMGIISMVVLPVLSTAFMAILSYTGAKYKMIRRFNIFIVYAVSFAIMLFLAQKGMSEDSIKFIVANFEGKRDASPHLLFITTLTLSTVGLSVLLLLIAIYLALLRNYYSESNKRDKRKSIKIQSVNRSLVLRELSIVRSNNTFLSELLMEQLIPVVLLVIYAVMGIAGDLLVLLEFEAISEYKGFLVVGILALFYSMSLVSSTSISREGKDFYLMKVFPIKAKDRVNSKIIFHMVFTLVFALPILLAFTLLMGINIPFILSSIVLLASLVFTVSTVGLLKDFSSPNPDWKIPTSAVKQNVNGLFGMLFMLPVLVLSGVIAYFGIKLGMKDYVVALLLSTLLIANGFILKHFTIKKAEKLLN